jgi:hypothetical protein
VALALTLAVTACSAETETNGFDFDGGTAGPMTTGESNGESGDTTAVGSTGEVDDGAESSGGQGDESGGSESTTGESVEPCTALDVVFVVDNSDTMIEEQIRLRGAANAFMTQLADQMPEIMGDMHIGVITTDEPQFVVADAEPCMPYASGLPYMTFGPTLGAELDCALDVGVAGDPNERPMDMLRGALSDELLMPGGFHDGFVREDALLLVVLVTDEEDDVEAVTQWGSDGDPDEWSAALADLKGGHAHDIVVLSLVGRDKPNECPAFQWDGEDGAEPAPRLIAFTDAFPNAGTGDVCRQEYATFLLDQVPTVVDACADFTPP